MRLNFISFCLLLSFSIPLSVVSAIAAQPHSDSEVLWEAPPLTRERLSRVFYDDSDRFFRAFADNSAAALFTRPTAAALSDAGIPTYASVEAAVAHALSDSRSLHALNVSCGPLNSLTQCDGNFAVSVSSKDELANDPWGVGSLLLPLLGEVLGADPSLGRVVYYGHLNSSSVVGSPRPARPTSLVEKKTLFVQLAGSLTWNICPPQSGEQGTGSECSAYTLQPGDSLFVPAHAQSHTLTPNAASLYATVTLPRTGPTWLELLRQSCDVDEMKAHFAPELSQRDCATAMGYLKEKTAHVPATRTLFQTAAESRFSASPSPSVTRQTQSLQKAAVYAALNAALAAVDAEDPMLPTLRLTAQALGAFFNSSAAEGRQVRKYESSMQAHRLFVGLIFELPPQTNTSFSACGGTTTAVATPAGKGEI